MRKWAKNVSRATAVAAGLAAAGAGLGAAPASADITSGDFSILGGNQVSAPVSVPVNISGLAGSVFGVSDAKSLSGAHAANIDQHGGQWTSGDFSILGGNQASAPISAPINVCGNSIAAFGIAESLCKGTASVTNATTGLPQRTSAKWSLAGGNQVRLPVSAPINVCGNSAAVFGVSEAACAGSASVLNAASGLPSPYPLTHSGARSVELPIGLPGDRPAGLPLVTNDTAPGADKVNNEAAPGFDKVTALVQQLLGKAPSAPAAGDTAGVTKRQSDPLAVNNEAAPGLDKVTALVQRLLGNAPASVNGTAANALQGKRLRPEPTTVTNGETQNPLKDLHVDALVGAVTNQLQTKNDTVAKTSAVSAPKTSGLRAARTTPRPGTETMYAVHNTLRGLGIPVPSEQAAKDLKATKPQIKAENTSKPGLPSLTRGLPISLAGNPVTG